MLDFERKLITKRKMRAGGAYCAPFYRSLAIPLPMSFEEIALIALSVFGIALVVLFAWALLRTRKR